MNTLKKKDNSSKNLQQVFIEYKKEIDYEFSLLEEFYTELKDKLKQIITTYKIEETTSFFLIKMFRLDSEKSNHFDLISFIEKIKEFSDVSKYQCIYIFANKNRKHIYYLIKQYTEILYILY